MYLSPPREQSPLEGSSYSLNISIVLWTQKGLRNAPADKLLRYDLSTLKTAQYGESSEFLQILKDVFPWPPIITLPLCNQEFSLYLS